MPKVEYVKPQKENGYCHRNLESKRYQEEAARKFREITNFNNIKKRKESK